MDKKYIELFKEIASSTASSAEQVMDYDKAKGDDKGFEAAQTLRDNFMDLHDKIVNNKELVRSNYAELLVGTMIVINNLQNKVVAMQKAINGFKNDTAPKLQKILDETQNDEEAKKLADEIFIIEDNK